MEEKQVFTLKNVTNGIALTHSHKIDPNKIQTIDDVIQIMKRLVLFVNDDGLKGIEHLIVDDEEEHKR
ncbi:hypothetical protein FKQ51_17760 [Bacillus toyonensis]|uniref:hypothetical protein n=1 Tax=Bacillus toyonensis TaxID=155322 RepID=UPI0026FF3AE7|nr:hypothetical protein [Bacillus toyonensis]MDO8159171.1 hypothetical protein [Bacillus toyonensis]